MKNKWYHAKGLPKRFHLNGHTIGFHQLILARTTLHISIIDCVSERVILTHLRIATTEQDQNLNVLITNLFPKLCLTGIQIP